MVVRLSQHGFVQIWWGRKWLTLPSGVTAAAWAVLSLASAMALFGGSGWIRWVGLIGFFVFVLAPALALIGALIWAGSQAYFSWLTTPWWKPVLGFLVAAGLIYSEWVGLLEPHTGYGWGGVVAAVFMLALFFRWRGVKP